MKMRPILGYSAAALTIVAAILAPFLLMSFFAQRVNGLGLKIDDLYGGGPIVRTINRGAYKIDIHKTFQPKFLQRGDPYV